MPSGSHLNATMDHSEPTKGRRPAPHEAMRCNVCDELFASFDKLMGHKRMSMKLEGTHIHCPVCTLDFNTMDAKDKHILEVSSFTKTPLRLCPKLLGRR